MKMTSQKLINGLFFVLCFAFLSANITFAAESESLEGMKSFKAVFDVRTGKAKSAVMLLGLIHQMYKDKHVLAVTDKPEFAVIFIGPSVKFISTQTKGTTPEEQELLKKISGIITAWQRMGSNWKYVFSQ